MFEADRFFALFLVRENVGNFEMLSSAQGSWFSPLVQPEIAAKIRINCKCEPFDLLINGRWFNLISCYLLRQMLTR